MKKILSLTLSVILFTALAGCAKEKSKGEAIASIGNYRLYKEDLLIEAELYPPAYRQSLTKEQILNDLIQKKILLMEAERRGLDEKPEFLKMVQRFWEQSLLRSLLNNKSEEIISGLKGPTDERNSKAKEFMRLWVDDLVKSADIRINKETLDRIQIK